MQTSGRMSTVGNIKFVAQEIHWFQQVVLQFQNNQGKAMKRISTALSLLKDVQRTSFMLIYQRICLQFCEKSNLKFTMSNPRICYRLHKSAEKSGFILTCLLKIFSFQIQSYIDCIYFVYFSCDKSNLIQYRCAHLSGIKKTSFVHKFVIAYYTLQVLTRPAFSCYSV